MRAAVFRGIRHFEMVELPMPQPGDGDILVKVDFCGICGSDLHTYRKGLYIKPGQVMGHEFSGVVNKVGSHVKGIEEGERVVIRPLFDCGECKHCLANRPHLCANSFQAGIGYGKPGGFAEYVVIPNALLNKTVFRLPPEITSQEAALIEPLAVAIHAVEMANLHLNDTVVVLGAGTIGLCISQVVKAIGGCHVIQVDISDLRLQAAKRLGADTIINAAKENVMEQIVSITGKDNFNSGAAADVVFECAGVPSTVSVALKCARFGGQVISVALSEEKTLLDPSIIVQKELSWKGSFGYINEFPTAIDLVKKGKIQLNELVSHLYPIDQVNEAFEKQSDSSASIKVCFQF
jgi:2-desacetyl-2-hydroxyethyl bacteriochlorophyllide A dehydrogenase